MKHARQRRPGSRLPGLFFAGILIVGIVLRIVHLGDVRSAPDFEAPLADAAFHDYWARGLATRDWTPPVGEPNPRLWEVPYLRPPGYPFFLAAIYATAGTDPLTVRVVQLVLGLFNVFLAWRLGRALLGEATGLVLAAFGATYWAFLYFEGELQATVLAQTLVLAALLALFRWAQRPSFKRALSGGVLVGMLALVRANALLFLPVAIVWILRVARPGPPSGAEEGSPLPKARPRATSALGFLLGAMLAILPVTVRNAVVSGEFFPISANGDINLHIGNHEGADGVSASLPHLERLTGRPGWSWFSYDLLVQGVALDMGRDPSYAKTGAWFRAKTVDFIRSHPRRFLELCGKRALLFWGPQEISNNKAIRYEKADRGVLAWWPGFPLVLALSVVGAIWLRLDLRTPRRDRKTRRGAAPVSAEPAPGKWTTEPAVKAGLALVGLFIATWFVSFVPFLAAARFRVPVLPLVFLFGAWGIVRAADSLRRRAWIAPAVWAGGAAVVMWGASRPILADTTDLAWWHTDRAVAMKRQGNLEGAFEELRAALVANPGFVDAHVRLAELYEEAGNLDGAIDRYAEVLEHRPKKLPYRLKLAQLLSRAERWPEAENQWSAVAYAMSDSPDVHFEYGRVLTENGKIEEAIAQFEQALELLPEQPHTLVNLGIALARMGRSEEAMERFEEAVAADPFLPEAHYHLGNALQEAGRLAEADREFREAFRVEPSFLPARVHLGNLLTSVGSHERAIAEYEAALAIDSGFVSALFNLSGALGNAGRLEEAKARLEEVLRIDPQYAEARQRLGVVESMIRQRDGSEP